MMGRSIVKLKVHPHYVALAALGRFCEFKTSSPSNPPPSVFAGEFLHYNDDMPLIQQSLQLSLSIAHYAPILRGEFVWP